MGSRPGFHKSEKRRKELTRQKKKEEKAQRRLNKAAAGPEGQEPGSEAPETEEGTESREDPAS